MCVPPQLIDLDLKGIDTVAVDLETYDPDLKDKGSGAVRNNGWVCGIAIATGKQTLYFPLDHKQVKNIPRKKAWKYLNEKLFQNPNIKKVFHNAMYDVCWIRQESGLMPKGPLLDTMVAASVIDENRMKYSLDSLSKDYLKDKKYKYDLREKSQNSPYFINDPMTNMHKLPYELVKEYAEQDVNLTLKLWKHFEKEINEKKIVEKGKKYEKVKTLRPIFELETELFPCLVDMRFKGVRINVEAAKKFGERLKKTKNNIIDYIKRRTGIKIEIWAASSIKKLLDKLKITDYAITPKSKLPQLPKDYLKTHKNHFIRLIAKAREFDKAEGTFVEGLLKFVHKGRIHADINQIRGEKGGTITGRFSMSNPNLQQIPAKGFIGKNMRALFLPEEGCSWGSFDYSQQEPRIVVHYALKLKMKGTEEVVESYKDDPNADFHQIVADMAKIPRITAKTINLGLFYGMGKNKLANQLDLGYKKAKELFDNYHKKVPFVKQLSFDLQKYAGRNKFLYTLEDRFCHFEKWEPINKEWKFKEKRFVFKDIETKIKKTKNEKGEEIEEEVEETIEIPVPLLLSKEKAKEHYHTQRAKRGYSPDPKCEYFENFYQPAFIYKALNRLVQGSAADMTKKAMLELYKKGIIPHIQIHDELCISITDNEQKEKIKDIMEQAIKLEIPNKVNYKTGSNWGSIK
jgi:DNA polymerase I-like protein with 3'-5' exonuclease and polymerase domains